MSNSSQQQILNSDEAEQLESISYSLLRNGLLWHNNEDVFIRNVFNNIANALNVERVSFFVFTKKYNFLRQLHQYPKSQNTPNTKHVEFDKLNYPEYFLQLSKNQLLASDNAVFDERFKELNNTYLNPQKVVSKIDLPVYKAGRLFGVLSVETLNQVKLWSHYEKTFLKQIVQLISQRFLYTDLKTKSLSKKKLDQILNVFDKSPLLCVLNLEHTGKIINANQKTLDLLQYKRDELISKNIFDLLDTSNDPEKLAPTTIQKLFNDINQKSNSSSEFFLRSNTDQEIPVQLSIESFQTGMDDKTEYILTALDISQEFYIRKALKNEESLYKHVINNSFDGVFILDKNTIVDGNDSLTHMFHCDRDKLVGSKIDMFLSQHQAQKQFNWEFAKNKFISAYKGVSQSFEIKLRRFDNELFDSEVTLNNFKSENKNYLLGTIKDISKRKQSKHTVSKSSDLMVQKNRSLDLINKLSNQLHASSSIQDIYTICVKTMADFEGFPLVTAYEVIENPYCLQFLMNSQNDVYDEKFLPRFPISKDLNGSALKSGEPLYVPDINIDKRIIPAIKEQLINDGYSAVVNIPLVYKNQEFGILFLTYKDAYPLTLVDIESLYSIAKNISLALSNARTISILEYTAHHDSLTGLSNRAYFHKQFKQQVLKGGHTSAALFLLDLDRFKEINDTLGHYTGDKILQKIGPRLKSIVEEFNFTVSRLGGDEFILVIYGISKKIQIDLIANKLLDTLAKPFKIDDLDLEIGTSVGIALYPHDGMDSHALLRSADVAMYGAKNIGGGYKYYDQNTDIHTPERLAMIAEMGSSINSGQLFLHYQPKINIVSQEVTGFEALARWEHPRLGLLNPNMFIPLIEMSNSIDQLTVEVLHQALAQQKEWRKKGKNYNVAVNISARNLIDNSLIFLLEEMLKKYDTDPNMLELEITETALMHDAYRATDYLTQITKLGIRLSIDDFGTGYSSLSYLQNLPIHKLKLDRGFIMGMLNNYQGSKIVETIISLANTLNLEVVAEGVEDAQTLNKLRELNCGQAQGYYICKPSVWGQIEHWLKRRELPQNSLLQ